jgi:lysozyme
MLAQQLAELRGDEGTRLTAYDDATGLEIVPGMTVIGHVSIGTGRCLDSRHGISITEAEYLLSIDIATIERRLVSLDWYVSLDPVRRGVMVNLAFNLGFNGLQSFGRMIAACERRDWNAAVAELLNSRWAEQVQPSRRDRLVQQLRTGELATISV